MFFFSCVILGTTSLTVREGGRIFRAPSGNLFLPPGAILGEGVGVRQALAKVMVVCKGWGKGAITCSRVLVNCTFLT